eukprot:TCONS_00044742-protein
MYQLYLKERHLFTRRCTLSKFIVIYTQEGKVCFALLLLCGDIERCPGPYNGLIEDTMRFCNTKGLKIFNLNIRGLQGSFDELKNLLLTTKIDIFALNEIFVNTDEDENDNTQNESYKSDTNLIQKLSIFRGMTSFIKHEIKVPEEELEFI